MAIRFKRCPLNALSSDPKASRHITVELLPNMYNDDRKSVNIIMMITMIRVIIRMGMNDNANNSNGSDDDNKINK